MTIRDVIKRTWFPVLCLVLFALLIWLGFANRALYFELKDQGKEPVSIGPITSPNDGRDGKSAYQIWLEQGNEGSRMDFLTSLEGRDGRDGEPGRDGIDGESVQGEPGANGQNGANGQDGLSIQGERGETGAQGLPGVPGTPGAVGQPGSAGADGKTPVLGCVVRTVNNLPVNYIAWKYTNEADSTYRNLYRVPNWAQPEGCINV